MTNAEKLAKDTDLMARMLAGFDECKKNCENCAFKAYNEQYEWCAKAQEISQIKEWLESEVEEDE